MGEKMTKIKVILEVEGLSLEQARELVRAVTSEVNQNGGKNKVAILRHKREQAGKKR